MLGREFTVKDIMLLNTDISQKLEKEHSKNDAEIKKELAYRGFGSEKKLVKCMRDLQEVFERPISVVELKEFHKKIDCNEKLTVVKEAVTAFQESEKIMVYNMERLLHR